MSIIEQCLDQEGRTAPGYEIIRMTVKKSHTHPGNEIRIIVDLEKPEPLLVSPEPRDLRAELEGILECEDWNKARGETVVDGRYNFKTGEITPPVIKSNVSVESPLSILTQRFVPVCGSDTLKRMHDRHSRGEEWIAEDRRIIRSHAIGSPVSLGKTQVITEADLEPLDALKEIATRSYTPSKPHTNGASLLDDPTIRTNARITFLSVPIKS